MEIERRIVDVPCEVRCEMQDGGKKRHIITGYAATFGTESRMLPGGFVETINKGAFDEVLATNPDVVGTYNHDKNYLLGRTANGTMKLSVDARGLKYEIWAPESRADVIESIERGDVVGSSFAFKVPRGFESWGENERGIRKRSIDKVGILEDVGPVVRPAYGSSTVIVSRRAIEEAVGESFRPNQTMANAAKRGLKLASGREGVDQSLFPIAERLQQREIVSPEEVEYLAATHQRLAELRSSSWNGTSAWVEYQLAGGESGEKWLARRMESPIFEEREDGLRPTAGMAASARRGLKLHEAGRSGDGLKPETVARAGKIAARESLTEDHVREMSAWFARHAVDRREGWDKAGEETPGFVAWELWGGDSGRSWSDAAVERMDKAEGRAVEVELAAEKMSEVEEEEETSAGELSPQNYDLFEAIKQIATREGPWSQDAADGAHYLPDSPFAEQGIRCENCVFWNAENNCDVVDGAIAPGGICKLWVIPEDRMTAKDQDQPAELEEPPAVEPMMTKRSDVDAALTAVARLKAQSLEAAAIGRA
jgi:hypothetical protein